MEQRVRLANLVAFYRANRPWMDRLAFSTRPQKWSDYNAFVSANIATNRVALTKAQAAAGTCIVAPYRVSEGNLPSVSVNRLADGQYATNLNVGDVNPTTASVSEVTAALLANNNGLWEGMQLSLIVNYQQQVGDVYRAIVRYYEVILSLSDSRTFASLMSDAHITAVNQSIGFTAGASDPVMGFAFILSADEGGKTRTSTQMLTLTSDTLYNTFTTASALTAAIESYGGGMVSPFLAGGYQGSSQGGVSIPLSILSVNGNAAGALLGSWSQNSNELHIQFSESIDSEATAEVVSILMVDKDDDLKTLTLTRTSVNAVVYKGEVVLETSETGVTLTDYDIKTIVVLVNGAEYTISFTAGPVTE